MIDTIPKRTKKDYLFDTKSISMLAMCARTHKQWHCFGIFRLLIYVADISDLESIETVYTCTHFIGFEWQIEKQTINEINYNEDHNRSIKYDVYNTNVAFFHPKYVTTPTFGVIERNQYFFGFIWNGNGADWETKNTTGKPRQIDTIKREREEEEIETKCICQGYFWMINEKILRTQTFLLQKTSVASFKSNSSRSHS